MNEINHKYYNIRHDNGKIIIDHKKAPNEWFYVFYNGLIGAFGTCFPAYVFYSNKHHELKASIIIAICFLSLWFLWGLINLAAALEILFLPTKSIIIIDKYEKTLKARLSFFGKVSIPFENIVAIQLSGHKHAYKSYYLTRTISRNFRFTQLQVLLINGTVKRIHRFSMHQKFKGLKYEEANISKHIAELIATETGVNYTWVSGKKRKQTLA